MRIDTEIAPVTVEIEGAEYALASRTVENAEKLLRAAEAAKGAKAEYELWLHQLEIMLGRAAVKELFPDGKGENLDRMEAIYFGVLDAFEYNSHDARTARLEASLAEAARVSEALSPVNELLRALRAPKETGFPTVKRPGK